MAKTTAICIGLQIPGVETEITDLRSKISLLDYDVAIFDPNVTDFTWRSETYMGKPSLSESGSVEFVEVMDHWRREILDALSAGKNVFVLLNQVQTVYVNTGKKEFSGTGKNRQTTIFVDSKTNYSFLPGNIELINSVGSSMLLAEKETHFAQYWAEMGTYSKFQVLLQHEKIKPIIKTKSGNKIVGANVGFNNSEGRLILLPHIEFDKEEYFVRDEDDEFVEYSKEATALGHRFFSAICEVNRVLNSSTELSTVPDWLSNDEFTLPPENKLREKLIDLEDQIEKLHLEKTQVKGTLFEETILKRLLYETGDPLETAVRSALEILGFNTSRYEDDESEFDVVFESEEGRLIGEVEGKDNKAINITKLRQLEMNRNEDLEREEVTDIAKGALFGNHFRLKHPIEREAAFTNKCLSAANSCSTVLIPTPALFQVVQYLSGKSDKRFAKKCRKAILDSSGIVTFPAVPTSARISKKVT